MFRQFFKDIKAGKAAKKKIKELAPQIKAKKVEGAIMRGERVNVAQTRNLSGLEFDNESRPLKIKEGGYR